MAIREATTSVEEPRPAGQRPDRRRRRRDLRAAPIPAAALGQWQDTEAALTLLYRYAEGRAIDAIDWYLQDKRSKRVWSRGLRLLVIVLVTAGGLQPLLDAAAPGARPHRLGLRAARPGRRLHRLRPVLRCLLGLDALHDHHPGPGAPPGAAPVRLGRRMRPQRHPHRRPQAGPEPPGPVAGRGRRHGRPHAAGDGRVGARAPEQPAGSGDLHRRLLELDPGPHRPGRESDGSRAPAGEGSPAPSATPAGR
jgi:hypothetical protein